MGNNNFMGKLNGGGAVSVSVKCWRGLMSRLMVRVMASK